MEKERGEGRGEGGKERRDNGEVGRCISRGAGGIPKTLVVGKSVKGHCILYMSQPKSFASPFLYCFVFLWLFIIFSYLFSTFPFFSFLLFSSLLSSPVFFFWFFFCLILRQQSSSRPPNCQKNSRRLLH